MLGGSCAELGDLPCWQLATRIYRALGAKYPELLPLYCTAELRFTSKGPTRPLRQARSAAGFGKLTLRACRLASACLKRLLSRRVLTAAMHPAPRRRLGCASPLQEWKMNLGKALRRKALRTSLLFPHENNASDGNQGDDDDAPDEQHLLLPLGGRLGALDDRLEERGV